ncbi:MAG TPA: hypothetical protein VHJ39_00855 [Solirubrobacteraceae bacterium]|nr:hypothetical protein [Solirubrobacteraceae bacterium]
MEFSQVRRVLIVANRTAATPTLLDRIKELARERPSTFALLIPDAASVEHTDWTLELALPLLERAARGPVEGLAGEGAEPFEAIRRAVGQGSYDQIVISTLPKRVSQWLRRDLPRRVQDLGVPVEVITPGREDRQPVGGVAGNISIP